MESLSIPSVGSVVEDLNKERNGVDYRFYYLSGFLHRVPSSVSERPGLVSLLRRTQNDYNRKALLFARSLSVTRFTNLRNSETRFGRSRLWSQPDPAPFNTFESLEKVYYAYVDARTAVRDVERRVKYFLSRYPIEISDKGKSYYKGRFSPVAIIPSMYDMLEDAGTLEDPPVGEDYINFYKKERFFNAPLPSSLFARQMTGRIPKGTFSYYP